MRNIYGNSAVFGDNFHGREDIVRHLKGILLSGNSFLLLGLRRIGKSSTIKEVVHQIEKEQHKVVVLELNCQTYKSIQDFYKHLNLALPKSWRTKVREVLKNSKRIPIKLVDFITDHIEELDLSYVGSIKLRNDAISYANSIKEELTSFFAEQKEQIIMVIDELPFLFEHIAKENQEATKLEIEMILATLRSWRDFGVAQAICGSLNLHLQLEELGISRKLLGGITTQKLEKYSREEAVGLLIKLSESSRIKLTVDHLDHILELIPDFIPQFLQYFFFNLKTHWKGEMAEIEQLYDKYVYPGIVVDFEYQFNERFAALSSDHTDLAIQILSLVHATQNISETSILKEINDNDAYGVLLILANQEFIILNEKQEYSFSFNIVRDWWTKKTI